MVDRKTLGAIVTGLKSAGPAARDLVASRLRDLLEADQLRGNEFRTVVRTLIDCALAETDPVAKESMFNALSSVSGKPAAAGVNWDPVASCLGDLDPGCLEHALLILGFSAEAKYEARVAQYLSSPDATIRSTAAEALALLDADKKQRACNN
jgi:hypothetical protein